MIKKTMVLSLLSFVVIMLSACGNATQVKEQVEGSLQDKIQENVQEVKQGAEGIVTGTLKDLVKKGQKQKCTWENSQAKGVVYMDGNKVSTQVTVVRTQDMPENMSVQTNMIDDGEWVYTWSDGMDTGTKMKSDVVDNFDDENITMNETEMVTDESMDINDINTEVMNYKCVKWVGNKSQFIPPKNVKFQDINAVMQGVQDVMQQNNNSQGNKINVNSADICAMAPTPQAKAECVEEMSNVKQQMNNISQ